MFIKIYYNIYILKLFNLHIIEFECSNKNNLLIFDTFIFIFLLSASILLVSHIGGITRVSSNLINGLEFEPYGCSYVMW